ncbi:hypothetical protein FEDK69T_04460 [Flavobacterium enshiense DK69]|uniref:Membrane protein n=1 Tax=Flavobacterium enshiense DK69 TaxID=1107311 RepID=V6SF52_9FLAO|nr:DUF3817 domain-containing protein [Flavobacterium enshiense]ESU24892.1 hypothetical protein FEDK69T_04460 [Flavobacterium enshiense DK69]KGO96664.1 membrane protein [Flavobacterium enshiense DK69]
MTRIFKIVALLEGLSLLVLFSNMIFLKPTNFDLYKTLLFPIGMTHGLLFVGYIVLATMFKMEDNWTWKKYFQVCVASVIPFGTFYVEKKIL